MHQAAFTHFQHTTPLLAELWERLDESERPVEVKALPSSHFYSELTSSIVSQQLSTKAAATIWRRFLDLAGVSESELAPHHVLAHSDEELRAVGMSRAKASYAKNIARAVEAGELDLPALLAADEKTVVAELTKIKGIGQWTAEMFMMFTLGKEDVFSFGDLGLRNALARWFGIDQKDLAAQQQLVAQWQPYRTYAARVLWRSLELPME